MRQMSLAAAFLLSSSVLAQAPGIIWEREYDFPNNFKDVVVTSDGLIACCGGTTTGLDLWCYDGEGNLLWQTGGGGTYSRGAARVIIPPSGGFAVAGTCGLSYGSGPDLYVSRYDASGTAIWNTALARPFALDYGLDIAALPDGGFAVCGYTVDSVLANQAWVLRFDSAGDTLWTRTWGWTYNDKAVAIEYASGGLTVLIQGRLEGFSGRPVLVRYSLDGDLLWMSTEMIGTGLDLCKAGTGYCALRSTMMTRLDELGQILWQMPVHYLYDHDFRTIRCTMDGGFLVAGADDFTMEVPYNDWNAHLSRYDPDGNWMWTSSLESGDDNWFYSAAQLPQGGYVAVGQHYTYEDVSRAYLVRFEPETGMEQPARPVGLVLQSCVPNPGSAVFSLSWSSEASGTSGVRVYDISGRLRLEQELGLMPEGEHSLQIDLQNEPSGCYLVVVFCGPGRASTKLVVLR